MIFLGNRRFPVLFQFLAAVGAVLPIRILLVQTLPAVGQRSRANTAGTLSGTSTAPAVRQAVNSTSMSPAKAGANERWKRNGIFRFTAATASPY